MIKQGKYYVTTPIYYPNGKFHIGTAYTTFLADTIKKYRVQRGYDTHLTTGNDEHGQKIGDTAIENGMDPQSFTDIQAKEAMKLWKTLEIDYDNFVRTTDEKHREQVGKIFTYFKEKGDIYLGKYVGNYCKSCEAYFTDTQAPDKKCPDCGKDTVLMEEEAYFFNMQKYVKKLIEYYETHPDFILPHTRKNEIMNTFLLPGLEDLCVTRTSFDWGVHVPGDEKHVIYVWLDALTNYITFLGYDVDIDTKKVVKRECENNFTKYWPASVHIVGKDILRFHGIYWPIFLMALDIELPETIYAHNWFVMKNGKMSKSKGNVVYPENIMELVGLDPLRYVLLKEMPYTHDGVLSPDVIISRYNTELCNDLSNLVHRLKGMIKKYEVESDKLAVSRQKLEEKDLELEKAIIESFKGFEENFEKFMFQKAIEEAWTLISKTNKYIDITEPWTLHKAGEKEKIEIFTYTILNALKAIGQIIYPFLPQTSKKILEAYNFEDEIQEGYKYIREGIEKGEIFGDVKSRPNYDHPVIYSRLTEEQEDEITKLFEKK